MKKTINYILIRAIRKTILTLLIVLAVFFTGLSLTGCVGGEDFSLSAEALPAAEDAEAAEAGGHSAGAAEASEMPEGKAVAIVLDVSGSTDSSFEESVRSALVDRVAGYIPSKPTDTKSGAAAVPGLRIAVYLIMSENANAYNNGMARDGKLVCTIPGTPALEALNVSAPEIPASGDTEEYLKAYQEWKALVQDWEKKEQVWSEAYDESLEQARDASDSIAAMNLEYDTSAPCSGIYNTICAVLGAMPGDKVNVGVFSDLLENGTDRGAPPAGKNGSVALCVPAPDGDVQSANEHAAALSETMMSWGFAKASVYAPDLLQDAVDIVFEG